MRFETKFSISDRVYPVIFCSDLTKPYQVGKPITIGQVRKIITDSPGCGQDTIFDNYKPKKFEVDEYMCVETGIGTGQVYTNDKLFPSLDQAQQKCDELNMQKKGAGSWMI